MRTFPKSGVPQLVDWVVTHGNYIDTAARHEVRPTQWFENNSDAFFGELG